MNSLLVVNICIVLSHILILVNITTAKKGLRDSGSCKYLGGIDPKNKRCHKDKVKFKKLPHECSAYIYDGMNCTSTYQILPRYSTTDLEIVTGYEPQNVFNADETGLFYRALPDKTFSYKGESCSGGKIAKKRLTVLLCVSMSGEKLQPLVIGKSVKPRHFKGIDVSKLAVECKANSKALITTHIMTDWLQRFDQQMKTQNRKIEPPEIENEMNGNEFIELMELLPLPRNDDFAAIDSNLSTYCSSDDIAIILDDIRTELYPVESDDEQQADDQLENSEIMTFANYLEALETLIRQKEFYLNKDEEKGFSYAGDDFHKNFTAYVRTIKTVNPGLEIGFYLSARYLTQVSINGKSSNWFDFVKLNDVLDFYLIEFTTFNECVEELLQGGITPIDSLDKGILTLNKFADAFKNCTIDKEKVYFEFLINPKVKVKFQKLFLFCEISYNEV
ncbi:hypothetical protein QTP88_017592 [Uroleucon formosanum]